MRDDRERLLDILTAINRILARTSAGKEKFDSDDTLQVWVLYHLQVLGEAARSRSAAYRANDPDKVWAKAVGLRNILVHHYFEIDKEEIWKIVEHDLAPLRAKVSAILSSL